MAEHKKPAKPKAEKAANKPKAEEQPPTVEVKEEATRPTPTPETAAPVAAEAKPCDLIAYARAGMIEDR